jgi:phospholipid/cholesterol/gamma-HCH transport system substrate-binding protein
LVAGALSAAALAALAAVLMSGPATYSLTAKLGEVQGLVPGAEVAVAGLKVGDVSSVYLGADGMPRVRMAIDRSFRLDAGASATVRTPSASGEENAFVELTRGGGRPLPDGAVLDSAHTASPVEVDQALSTFNPRTRAAARATLRGLDRSFQGRGADLAAVVHAGARSLGSTVKATREVASDGAALRELVTRGRQVSSTLASSRDELGAVAERLAATLHVTAARQGDLARAAELLPAGLRSPRLALDRLDRSVGRYRRLVSDAAPGIAAVVPFARALSPTLQRVRPALAGASSLVREAPGMLATARPLLAEAAPTLRRLDPVLRSARPILNQARVRTPDFFSFFSNWADFTGVYDASGHAARVSLVMPPAPNNTIGPSDSGAGSLEAPFLRTPGVLDRQPWRHYRRSFLGRRR